MNIYEPRKDKTLSTVQPIEDVAISGTSTYTKIVSIYVCDPQEVKSSIKIGNMVIYLPVKAGRLRKIMFKYYFGLDLKSEEARVSAC